MFKVFNNRMCPFNVIYLICLSFLQLCNWEWQHHLQFNHLCLLMEDSSPLRLELFSIASIHCCIFLFACLWSCCLSGKHYTITNNQLKYLIVYSFTAPQLQKKRKNMFYLCRSSCPHLMVFFIVQQFQSIVRTPLCRSLYLPWCLIGQRYDWQLQHMTVKQSGGSQIVSWRINEKPCVFVAAPDFNCPISNH